MELKVKRLHEAAKLPTQGHPGDAGIDLFALETVVIPPHEQRTIRTGIALEIPEGYVGLVWDKSSIAFGKGLKVMGGVIDAGFRGEVTLLLYNTGTNEQMISAGNKASQIVIQAFASPAIVEVSEISDTVRGEGREGSTGSA